MASESAKNQALSLGRRHFLTVGAGSVATVVSGTGTIHAANADIPRVVSPPQGKAAFINKGSTSSREVV